MLLSTSGTAAANFHPAVVEAGLSDVPMLVVTADRPPELRDVGAPQTIDQRDLYGRSVRWFHDPGIADAVRRRRAGGPSPGAAVAAAATGPVHLNLPFREPLLGEAGELPPPASVPVVTLASTSTAPDGVAELLAAERGLILAGGRSGVAADDVAILAKATGWPVLADPTSGCRHLASAVAAFDSILRVEAFASAHQPDVVVRVGRPAASKVLATWIAASAGTVVQVGGPAVIDPDHGVALDLPASSIGALAALAAPPAGSSEWTRSWREAAESAEQAIAGVLGAEPALSEPGVARSVAENLPAEACLVVASSMPVRDLEWFGGPTANRPRQPRCQRHRRRALHGPRCGTRGQDDRRPRR